jgi:hypothetical protein
MTHLSTVHINCEAISKYVIVFRNQNKGLTFSFCGFSAVSLNIFVTMLVLLSHLKFVHGQQRNVIIAVNGLEFCTANITVWNFKIILKTQTCIMLLTAQSKFLWCLSGASLPLFAHTLYICRKLAFFYCTSFLIFTLIVLLDTTNYAASNTHFYKIRLFLFWRIFPYFYCVSQH